MSVETYLGEFDVLIQESPFAYYTPKDWALEFVGRYGGIDGEHHKLWVLDQVARVLLGTPVIVKVARWTDHADDFRFWTGVPSNNYLDWVKDLKDGEDGPDSYGYDVGICP